MKEKQWLTTKKLEPMLKFLSKRSSDRKLRLFACACCRRIGRFLTQTDARTAVEAGERLADGKAKETELKKARALDAWKLTAGHRPNDAYRHAADAARETSLFFCNTKMAADHCVLAVVADAHHAKRAEWEAACKVGKSAALKREFENVHWDEVAAQTMLLRHIIGNPLRPYAAPASWPAAVVELAQALYDGAGDRLILADALEEGGHTDLAKHFRAEDWHPKGCWVVDMVLGKA